MPMLRSIIVLGPLLLFAIGAIGADGQIENRLGQGGNALRRRAEGEANNEDDHWIPEDPEDVGYFNYHPSSKYGPSNWGSLSPIHIKKTPERKYWKFYKQFIDLDLYENQCGSGSARQSPIDISSSAINTECLEYHEIKDRRGKYYIDEKDSDVVSFEILDTKLRINYAFDDEEHEAYDWGGPNADIPKGWGGQLPVLHVDMKVPSEHTIDGRRFPMEYQIFLLQNSPSKRGAPVVTVLFDLHPEDKSNEALQIVLDEFQKLWDEDKEKCDDLRRDRQLNLVDEKHRQQKSIRWDAFDEEILRSVWFWGYLGSLTEPPCSEFCEYRIIDVPALLSKRQLEHVHSLLFDRVDPKRGCRKVGGSIANNGESVARPTQSLQGRELYKCNCRDYINDFDRLWYGRNRCWDGDQSVFHEEIFTSAPGGFSRVDGGEDLITEIEQARNWVTTPATKPDKSMGAIWNCYHDDSVEPPCCGGMVKNKRYGCN
jgi:carbonic anhydrase